jgi:hypothetical protein
MIFSRWFFDIFLDVAQCLRHRKSKICSLWKENTLDVDLAPARSDPINILRKTQIITGCHHNMRLQKHTPVKSSIAHNATNQDYPEGGWR